MPNILQGATDIFTNPPLRPGPAISVADKNFLVEALQSAIRASGPLLRIHYCGYSTLPPQSL